MIFRFIVKLTRPTMDDLITSKRSSRIILAECKPNVCMLETQICVNLSLVIFKEVEEEAFFRHENDF